MLNGFLQSLVGLHDFADATGDRRARRLFRDGDRAARREISRYDTGAWSLYSLGGNESDLGYHRLVRDFLVSLCERTKAGGYCAPAKRFDRYLHERTRVGFSGVGRVRVGGEANIRFALSKLSCVTVRVRRGAKLVHVRKLVMPRGLRALDVRAAAQGALHGPGPGRRSAQPLHARRAAAGRQAAQGAQVIEVAPEVADALSRGGPVVALESTIIAHGLPRPDNARIARDLEQAVRAGGAVPATIALLDGAVRVGLDDEALEAVASRDDIAKCSARDLPLAAARGASGATTVAATAHLAARAGIRLFATGGLGGVHREAHETWDESADLVALSRTDICVVCAGVKSILDVAATLERLETLGVGVAGYRTDRFAGFYLADSGHAVPWRLDSPAEVAAALRARAELGIGQRARDRQPARRAARPGAARARAHRCARRRRARGRAWPRRHAVPARGLPPRHRG